MKLTLANWNGQEMPLDEVRVPVLDRAFLFGDAVYEVIRIYSGRAWKITEHLNRLNSSLAAIGINGVDLDRLRERLTQTLTRSRVLEGLIYIQVSRGVAPRTHHFPERATPNQLIYVQEFADPYSDRRSSGIEAITFPDIRWARNEIKATSLLANCLAAQAAVEAGCLEAILIDSSGLVTEGSHTSVFGVRNGKILVSPPAANILPGITKRQVIELANLAGIAMAEERLAKDDIEGLDELFLTGTPEEILPIVRVDGCPVGSAQAGPITSKLQATFRQAVANWLACQDNS